MKRGRKTKPAALKLVAGNPGKRPLNAAEPRPEPGAPEAPDWLADEARAEWARVVAQLIALGIVTRLDRAVLAAYCSLWARFVDGEKASTPINAASLSQMRIFAAELGLTPSSRASLSTGAVKTPPSAWDRLGGGAA